MEKYSLSTPLLQPDKEITKKVIRKPDSCFIGVIVKYPPSLLRLLSGHACPLTEGEGFSSSSVSPRLMRGSSENSVSNHPILLRASGFSLKSANIPFLKYLYPTQAIMAALSVQYCGDGMYTLIPFASASFFILSLSNLLQATPPDITILLIPDFLAALIVFDTMTSTTAC